MRDITLDQFDWESMFSFSCESIASNLKKTRSQLTLSARDFAAELVKKTGKTNAELAAEYRAKRNARLDAAANKS